MKKIMLFLNCILSISLIDAGVSTDTMIETTEGLKEIRILKVGDKIVCLSDNLMAEERAIESIEEVEAPSIIEITTEDGVVIRVAADQKLFVPYKWVQADQLTLGDVLSKKDRTFIRIKGICHKQEAVKLNFITVEKNHNFLVSENGVLVHNGPWAAYIAYTTTKASMYAALVGAVAGTVVVTGVAIAGAAGVGTVGAGTASLGVSTAAEIAAITSSSALTIAGTSTTTTIITGSLIEATLITGSTLGIDAGVSIGLGAITTATGATLGAEAAAIVGAISTGTSAAITVSGSVAVGTTGIATATTTATTTIAGGGFAGSVTAGAVATAAFIEATSMAAFTAALALPGF